MYCDERDCLYVCSHTYISATIQYTSVQPSQSLLRTLPLVVAGSVLRGGVAIRYVLPVHLPAPWDGKM